MNYIDIIVLIFIILMAVYGYFRGAIREAGDIEVSLSSIFVAVLTFQWVALHIHLPSVIPDTYLRSASFFMIWFVSELLLYLVFTLILRRIPLNIVESNWNDYLGSALAAAKGGLLIFLSISVITLLPLGKDFSTDFYGSFTVKVFSKQAARVSDWFASSFSEESVVSDFITLGGQKDPRAALGYKTPQPERDSLSESKLLASVNSARKESDLDILKVDDKLSALALAHAFDLAKSGFLSQNSSDGKSLIERAEGLEYSYVSENDAVGMDVASIVAGMKANGSDSANIYSPVFENVGVSVVGFGTHGKLVVMEFAGK